MSKSIISSSFEENDVNVYSRLTENVDSVLQRISALYNEENQENELIYDEDSGDEYNKPENQSKRDAISEGMASFNGAYESIRLSDRIELLSAANRWLEEKVDTFMSDLPNNILLTLSDSEGEDDSGDVDVDRRVPSIEKAEEPEPESREGKQFSREGLNARSTYATKLANLKAKYKIALKESSASNAGFKRRLKEDTTKLEVESKSTLAEWRKKVISAKKELMALDRKTGPFKWGVPVDSINTSASERHRTVLDASAALLAKLSERFERRDYDCKFLAADLSKLKRYYHDYNMGKHVFNCDDEEFTGATATLSPEDAHAREEKFKAKLFDDYLEHTHERDIRERELQAELNKPRFDPNNEEGDGSVDEPTISSLYQVRAFHLKTKENYLYLKAQDTILNDDFGITRRKLSERIRNARGAANAMSAQLASARSDLATLKNEEAEEKGGTHAPSPDLTAGGAGFPVVPPSPESRGDSDHVKGKFISSAAFGCFSLVQKSKGTLLIRPMDTTVKSKQPPRPPPPSDSKKKKKKKKTKFVKRPLVTELDKMDVRDLIDVVQYSMERFKLSLGTEFETQIASLSLELTNTYRAVRMSPDEESRGKLRTICAKCVHSALMSSFVLLLSKNSFSRFSSFVVDALAITNVIINTPLLGTLPDVAKSIVPKDRRPEFDGYCCQIITTAITGRTPAQVANDAHKGKTMANNEKSLNAGALIEALSDIFDMDMRWNRKASSHLETLEAIALAEYDRYERAVRAHDAQTGPSTHNTQAGWTFVGLDENDAKSTLDRRIFTQERRLVLLAFEIFLVILGSSDERLTAVAELAMLKLTRGEIVDLVDAEKEFPVLMDVEVLSKSIDTPLVPVILTMGYLRALLCESVATSNFVSDIRMNRGSGMDELQYLNDKKYADAFKQPVDVSAREVALALENDKVSRDDDGKEKADEGDTGDQEIVSVSGDGPAKVEPPSHLLEKFRPTTLRSRLGKDSNNEEAVSLWLNDVLEQVERARDKVSDRAWTENGQNGWVLPEALRNEVLGLSDHIVMLACRQSPEGEEGINRLQGAVKEVVRRITMISDTAEDIVDALAEGLKRDLRRKSVIHADTKEKLEDFKKSSKTEAEYLFVRGKVLNKQIDKLHFINDEPEVLQEIAEHADVVKLLANPDDDGGMERLLWLCTRVFNLKTRLGPLNFQVATLKSENKSLRAEMKELLDAKRKAETVHDDDDMKIDAPEEDELLDLFIDEAETEIKEKRAVEEEQDNSFQLLASLMAHKSFRLRLQMSHSLTATRKRQQDERQRIAIAEGRVTPNTNRLEEDSVTGEARIVSAGPEPTAAARYNLDMNDELDDDFEEQLSEEAKKRKLEQDRIAGVNLSLDGRNLLSPRPDDEAAKLGEETTETDEHESTTANKETMPGFQLREPGDGEHQRKDDSPKLKRDMDAWVGAVLEETMKKSGPSSKSGAAPQKSGKQGEGVRLPVLGETFAPPSIDLSQYGDDIPSNIVMSVPARVPTETVVDHRAPTVVVRTARALSSPSRKIVTLVQHESLPPIVEAPSVVEVDSSRAMDLESSLNNLTVAEEWKERLTTTKYAEEFVRLGLTDGIGEKPDAPSLQLSEAEENSVVRNADLQESAPVYSDNIPNPPGETYVCTDSRSGSGSQPSLSEFQLGPTIDASVPDEGSARAVKVLVSGGDTTPVPSQSSLNMILESTVREDDPLPLDSNSISELVVEDSVVLQSEDPDMINDASKKSSLFAGQSGSFSLSALIHAAQRTLREPQRHHDSSIPIGVHLDDGSGQSRSQRGSVRSALHVTAAVAQHAPTRPGKPEKPKKSHGPPVNPLKLIRPSAKDTCDSSSSSDSDDEPRRAARSAPPPMKLIHCPPPRTIKSTQPPSKAKPKLRAGRLSIAPKGGAKEMDKTLDMKVQSCNKSNLR